VASREELFFLLTVSRPGYNTHTIRGLARGVSGLGRGAASGASAPGSIDQGAANENN